MNNIETKKLGENNLLMRFNRKLGKKRTIIVTCSLMFLFIFLLGNYFINIMISSLNKDFTNLFMISNIFSLKNVGSSGFSKFFYVVLILMDTIFTLKTAYRMYTAFADMNIGQKGTSRWTTVEEIKEQYQEIEDRDKEFPGYGGIPVARIENKLYIDSSNTNNIILGITRSGKGEMFVVPCIDAYSRGTEKASMVVLDMKMELICRSYHTLKERGYEVLFLNIQDGKTGVQYNPLDLIVKYYLAGNKSDAELLCNSFAYSIYKGKEKSGGGDDNTDFFLSNASSALTALIMAHIEDCNTQDMRDNAEQIESFIKKQAMFEQLSDEDKEKYRIEWEEREDKTFTKENLHYIRFIPTEVTYEYTHENLKKVTVPSIVNTFTELARIYINPHTTQLDIYFQKRPAGDRAKAIFSSIEVSGDRTKGSIFSQALTKLNIYMFENITQLTSTTTFDIESIGFGDKPVALFVGVPFYDRSKDSIVSTLIGQIFQANARRAAASSGQKCIRKIIFHLDEIGNYPPIQDFKTMLSVGLGCNMLFNLFLQNYSQLDSTYGDDAKTIKANAGNQIYIQTSLYDTAEEFSKLLGNETITNLTRTGKKLDLAKSFTELNEERPLMNANELMELRPGENVIKRVMKRTDIKGNKVVPRPILNSIDRGTDYLFSYEYLDKTFPSNQSLDDLPLPAIIAHETNFYNYHITMNKYAYEYLESIIESGDEEAIAQITEAQIKEYKQFKAYYRFDKLVGSCKQKHSYMACAKKNKIPLKETSMIGELFVAILMSNMELKEKIQIMNTIEKEF